MLTLCTKLYEKALELFLVLSTVVKLCKVHEFTKETDVWFFHFSETRPAKWPSPWTKQNNLWNTIDVLLSLFPMVLFWLLLDYFYVLLISESWSYPNFQRARLSCWLWITVLHFDYLWKFFSFLFSFKELFQNLPLWFSKRNNSNTWDLAFPKYWSWFPEWTSVPSWAWK